jgi:hypothetical protein
MASIVTFVVDTQAPLLDHVGVELARRQHAARQVLVSENPSVTYELLATARHQTEPAARQWIRRMREAGKVVTVDYGNTLIPSFQFDQEYNLVPAVSGAVHELVEAGMPGWAIWRWFCTVSPWLGDKPERLAERGQFAELEDLVQRFLAGAHGG